MLVVPDVSEILMLQYLVNMLATDGSAGPSGGHRLLRLFTNNATIDDSITFGGLTEATAAGYAPFTLVGSAWTTTQSVGVTTAVHSETTFTFTTGVTVYGYYVTNLGSSLLWVEKFSGAPFTLPAGGGEIAITPKITLD